MIIPKIRKKAKDLLNKKEDELHKHNWDFYKSKQFFWSEIEKYYDKRYGLEFQIDLLKAILKIIGE